MKRSILTFISCLAMVASFTACGNDSNQADNSSKSSTETTTAVTTTATTAAESGTETTTGVTTETTTTEVADTTAINAEAMEVDSIINNFKLGDSYSLVVSSGDNEYAISRQAADDFYITLNFTIEDDTCMSVYQRSGDKTYLSAQSSEEEIYYVANADDTDIIKDFCDFDSNDLSLKYNDQIDDTSYSVTVNSAGEDMDGEVSIENGVITSISFGDAEIRPNEYTPLDEVEREYTEVSIEELNDNFGSMFIAYAMTSTVTSTDDLTESTEMEDSTETEESTEAIDDSEATTVEDLKVSGYTSWGDVSATADIEEADGTIKTVTYTFANKQDGEDYMSWWDNREDGKDLYISVKAIDNGEDWYKITEVLDHYYK